MIPNEVRMGLKCYTRISSEVATLVEVVEDTKEGTKRYRVKRLDTGAILRKLRGPGELHATPGPWTRPARAEHPLYAAAAKKTAVPAHGPAKKPGVAKVQTLSPRASSQTEILRRLAVMPEEDKKFFIELLSIPSAIVPRVERRANQQ